MKLQDDGSGISRFTPRPMAAVSGLIASLGIDVGDTTGMLAAQWEPGLRKAAWARAFQCDMGSSAQLLAWILDSWQFSCGGIEAFALGPRSSRLAGISAAAVRAQQEQLTVQAARDGLVLAARRAVDIKGWATDDRLHAAGLWAVTKGQKHAADGGRAALYAACRDYGLPDPLSRRAGVVR